MSEGSSRDRALARLVSGAAEQITRLSPADAAAAVEATGVLIDIRSRDSREAHGFIPGSLHIPRTVLEWRVALESEWRNPYLAGADQYLILVCDHGYSSVLAAANLVQLGFHRAGDVIGGYEGWAASGLPVAHGPARVPEPGALPGMGPPD